MIIHIGADHRGFKLKEMLKDFLHGQGYEVADLGAATYEQGDDYPDFAAAVAKKVVMEPEVDRGILICGSGVGMDVVANKFLGIRAATAISADQVYAARHDDDVNVLCLASDFISEEDAKKIVGVFMATPFSGEERRRRRLNKIAQIESEN